MRQRQSPTGRSSAPQSALLGHHHRERARPGVRAGFTSSQTPTGVLPTWTGKILQANEAVSQLLGFRQDEVVEQSLSRFISAEETREFTAALGRSSSTASPATPSSTRERVGRGDPDDAERLGPPRLRGRT